MRYSEQRQQDDAENAPHSTHRLEDRCMDEHDGWLTCSLRVGHNGDHEGWSGHRIGDQMDFAESWPNTNHYVIHEMEL